MQSLWRRFDYWFWPVLLPSALIVINAIGFPFKILRYHGFPFTFAIRWKYEIESFSSVALLFDIAFVFAVFFIAWKISAWRFREPGTIAPNFTTDHGPRTTD